MGLSNGLACRRAMRRTVDSIRSCQRKRQSRCLHPSPVRGISIYIPFVRETIRILAPRAYFFPAAPPNHSFTPPARQLSRCITRSMFGLLQDDRQGKSTWQPCGGPARLPRLEPFSIRNALIGNLSRWLGTESKAIPAILGIYFRDLYPRAADILNISADVSNRHS